MFKNSNNHSGTSFNSVIQLYNVRFSQLPVPVANKPGGQKELFQGWKVFLYREPLNKSDANAIAVLNTNSKVVDHLRRTEVANIAPHLDYTTCIWGTVAETAHGYWNTSVIMFFFCPGILVLPGFWKSGAKQQKKIRGKNPGKKNMSVIIDS